MNAEPPLLLRNPAAKASPPTARAARPPEMHPWTAAQLTTFLGWSAGSSSLHTAWQVLAMTGMRRGELLALRWRDVDLAAATITVRRSAGIVRNKGEGAQIGTGPTKTGTSRVIDIDPGTVALLRAWKRDRGRWPWCWPAMTPWCSATLKGGTCTPSGSPGPSAATGPVRQGPGRCRAAEIRLHDLRHTHASLLLADGEPVKTVSERLGHASATVTMTVYAHVMPGDQKRAASRFAALIEEATS